MYACVGVCTCLCVGRCVWVCVCLCACMHAYVCMHACVHIYVHNYVFVCMYLCMLYVYVCEILYFLDFNERDRTETRQIPRVREEPAHSTLLQPSLFMHSAQILLKDCQKCYISQRGQLLLPIVTTSIETYQKQHGTDTCNMVRYAKDIILIGYSI